MADKRPWAKMDTGYVLNPKWFQVHRALLSALPEAMLTAMPGADRAALRAARDAHLTSILYCKQNETDGYFPVAQIKALSGVQEDWEEAAVTALFDLGLWINHPGGMAEVRDYLEHQEPASKAKDRSEQARNAANARWGNDPTPNAQRNAGSNAGSNAQRNAEKKRKEKKSVAARNRDDIKTISSYLADRVEANGSKRPNISDTWINDARLLIDHDKRSVTEIKELIDWSQQDSFWKSIIMSMSSLRKHFDKVRLQRQERGNAQPADEAWKHMPLAHEMKVY